MTNAEGDKPEIWGTTEGQDQPFRVIIHTAEESDDLEVAEFADELDLLDEISSVHQDQLVDALAELADLVADRLSEDARTVEAVLKGLAPALGEAVGNATGESVVIDGFSWSDGESAIVASEGLLVYPFGRASRPAADESVGAEDDTDQTELLSKRYSEQAAFDTPKADPT